MAILQANTDIVFLIDTTSSMSDEINRVKNSISNFADSLAAENVSFRLGLVDFGYYSNGYSNQYVKNHGFFEDVETFKNELSALTDDGWDEYGLTAIQSALGMDFNEGVTKRFIMLTNEGYYENGESGTSSSYSELQADTVIEMLNNAGVVLDVVGSLKVNDTYYSWGYHSCQDEYEPIANATGGKFYDISLLDYTATFEEIVQGIVTQNTGGVMVDLNDVGENQTGLFIVNKITAEDGTTSINPDAVFVPNALNYNNHIYAVYSNVNTTWNDAKTYCENLGGHLVTITDEAEQAAVQNLLQNEENPVNSYWIGGYTESEVATEGWQWTSGETIPAGEAVNAEGANYSNWAAGEPNNINENENSLMMFNNPYPDSGAAFGTWNDLNSDGTLNSDEFYGTANIGVICEWDNAEVVGEVTEANIYTAAENTEYNQNITIPENWDVTATANNDILNITADGVTAEGGEGSDRFAVSSGVNDVVFADFTPADDSLSFADRIPEESLHESYSSGELMLSNDDISLTFQNMAGLTEELLNEEVNNGGFTNTVEQLIESVPYVTVNQDAPVMMSLSHWSYGFYPATE